MKKQQYTVVMMMIRQQHVGIRMITIKSPNARPTAAASAAPPMLEGALHPLLHVTGCVESTVYWQFTLPLAGDVHQPQ